MEQIKIDIEKGEATVNGKTYKLTPVEEVSEYPKILEFRSKLAIYSINKDNRYFIDGLRECSHSLDSMLHVERCVDSGDIAITKVAKDKDTIFTIGDNTNYGVIYKFNYGKTLGLYLINDGEWVSILHVCHKINQPIFTTSDGLLIFENTPYYSVNKKYFTLAGGGIFQQGGCASNEKEWITFSCYERAEAWIRDNKPAYSRKQINEALDKSKVRNEKSYLYCDDFVKILESRPNNK